MSVGTLDFAGPSRQVQAMIGDVVDEMRSELDDASGVVSDSIHQHCPALDDELYFSTRQSTRANLGLINTMLADAADPTVFSPPEEALSYARSYVHEGLSMEALTASYRQGQRAYSRVWLDRLKGRAETADQLADAMGYFSDFLFAYIESINRPLSEVYTAEHERRIRGGAGDALRGGPLDPRRRPRQRQRRVEPPALPAREPPRRVRDLAERER